VFIAADYPFLDVFWTMLIFVMWVIWIWIVVLVFMDLFRRSDVSGWGKAGWSLFVILLPYLGVFVYLITQGRGMGERREAEVRSSKAEFEGYVREVATDGGPAGQIAEAKKLLDSGAIDAEEYEQLKAKALA
jgi:Short C-terminal domain